jgi:hypothetical protein
MVPGFGAKRVSLVNTVHPLEGQTRATTYIAWSSRQEYIALRARARGKYRWLSAWFLPIALTVYAGAVLLWRPNDSRRIPAARWVEIMQARPAKPRDLGHRI